MRRIDFMGVPGSGKSKTFAELKHISKQDKWLFPVEATTLAVKNCASERYSKKPENLRKKISCFIINNDLASSLTRERKHFLRNIRGEFYTRFAYANGDFTHNCGESLKMFMESALPVKIRFFLGAQVFIIKAAELQLLEDYLPIETMVVFDESLSHKMYEMVNFDSDPLSDRHIFNIRNIFNTMPLPELVFDFNESKKLIEDRLKEKPRLRQKDILHNKNRSISQWVDDAILFKETALSVLLSRGAEIISLPKNLDYKDKAIIIRKHLKKRY